MKKQDLINLIISGIGNLSKNLDYVNDLNVFPIPDGDTGTNMLETLVGGYNSISDRSEGTLDISEEFVKGCLFSAKGNSGVILSQIIKGFMVGVNNLEWKNLSFSISSLEIIFDSIIKVSYSAVSNPVEGTILSVAKYWKSNLDRFKSISSLKNLFHKLVELSEEATNKTTEQLDVLKEANVVDSGAYGLTKIIEGVFLCLDKKPVPMDFSNVGSNGRNVMLDREMFDASKNIGYCTEFIIGLRDKSNFDEKDFNLKLNKFGDSIVYIKEEDMVKVHIHTKSPGTVFNFAQEYGEFMKVKSENMALQVDENKSFVLKEHIKDELGIFFVSTGEGLSKYLLDIGVNEIITGGQTSNPSISDFVKKIKESNYENILILPNNSNIILTIEQVLKLKIENKNVYSLNTKTILEGLFAVKCIDKKGMLDFDKYRDDFIDLMKSQIKQGLISKANKNTTINNVKINNDDYLAIVDEKKIISSKKDISESIVDIFESNYSPEETIDTTIFYSDLTSDQILDIKSRVLEKYDLKLDLIDGGQDIYNILILFE